MYETMIMKVKMFMKSKMSNNYLNNNLLFSQYFAFSGGGIE